MGDTLHSLTVGTGENKGIGGIMWNVKATVDVKIVKILFTFNGSPSGNQRYNLYYKNGTLEGYRTDANAWKLQCEGTTISEYISSGNHLYNGITNDSICAITIPANTTYALYIWGVTSTLVSDCTKTGSDLTTIAANDNYLTAYYGLGTFQGKTAGQNPFNSPGYGDNKYCKPKIQIFYTTNATNNPTPRPSQVASTPSPTFMPSIDYPIRSPSDRMTSHPTSSIATNSPTIRPSLDPTFVPTNKMAIISTTSIAIGSNGAFKIEWLPISIVIVGFMFLCFCGFIFCVFVKYKYDKLHFDLKLSEGGEIKKKETDYSMMPEGSSVYNNNGMNTFDYDDNNDLDEPLLEKQDTAFV